MIGGAVGDVGDAILDPRYRRRAMAVTSANPHMGKTLATQGYPHTQVS